MVKNSLNAFKSVWLIAGPTASGKSALALELARRFDGVVINADSMQVYREIPVLSAQPSFAECDGAPHRLYGFQPIAEAYSAADWAVQAVQAIHEAYAANRQPILVGGSGLYFKALIDGFSPMPQVPPALRLEMCALHDRLGAAAFHAKLAAEDPASADRLHPSDRQRCIRAREVFAASGQPLSFWQRQPKRPPDPALAFKSFILLPPRAWLHARIDRRFVQMVENGAIDEARRVNALNPDPMLTGTRAVGLQALREMLDGHVSLAAAIALGQTASRQYAKRQYTWFRNQALPDAVSSAAQDEMLAREAAAHFA